MPANLENAAVAPGPEIVSFIPVSKKGSAKECFNYLTIVLILLVRLYSKSFNLGFSIM